MTQLAKLTTKQIGDTFEQKAQAFLRAKNLSIIAKNYRVPRVGEIDLVAYDPVSDTLICVEVKRRKSTNFGSAAQMVTPAKQQKLIAAMMYFLQAHGDVYRSHVRFDVVAFDGLKESCVWLQGAFLLQDGFNG